MDKQELKYYFISVLAVLCLFLRSGELPAQNKVVDSLKKELTKPIHDTTRCSVFSRLVSETEDLSYNEEIVKIATENLKTCNKEILCNFYQAALAEYFSNKGIDSYHKGNLAEAKLNWEKALDKALLSKNKNAISSTLNNLGNYYYRMSDIPQAINYFKRALAIDREIGRVEGEASCLNNIGYMLWKMEGDQHGAIEYFTQSYNIRKKIGDKKGQATCLINIACAQNELGENAAALENTRKAMAIRIEIKDKGGIAEAYDVFHVIYDGQGNIPLAISNLEKALAIYEKLENKGAIRKSLNDLASIYYKQGEIDKALKIFYQCLEQSKVVGEPAAIALSNNNIGAAYRAKGILDSALFYFIKSLNEYNRLDDKDGAGRAMNNIGSVNEQLFNREGKSLYLDSALVYYMESYRLKTAVNEYAGVCVALNNMCGIYIRKENYTEALNTGKKAMALAGKLKMPALILRAAQNLYQIHKVKGDYKSAFEAYETYIKMNDSLNNESNKKAAIKSQLKYEYEKKAAADSVKVAEEKKVVQAQLKQEKTQRYSLYGGLALVLIFALFMVNRFRVTNKQKKLIEEQKITVEKQKHMVELKQAEILDSIRYAKRIQIALITSESYIHKKLLNLNK